MAFTADQTKPRLAVIDTATNKVKQWVAVPGANRVAVVDLRSMEVVRSIEVPRAPQEVLIRPDDLAAYVSCDASHQVAEIGLTDWKVRLIEAGAGADGLAWAAAGA